MQVFKLNYYVSFNGEFVRVFRRNDSCSSYDDACAFADSFLDDKSAIGVLARVDIFRKSGKVCSVDNYS